MTARYRVRGPKPAEVYATQWTGDNLTDLYDFAGARFWYDPRASQGAVQVSNGNWRYLRPGTWVIRDSAGLSVCAAVWFPVRFSPIPDRLTA